MSTNDTNPNKKTGPLQQVKIAVVYDNHSLDERLKSGWGFSAVITAGEKIILFDTGADAGVLLENMARMRVAPQDIELAAISHHHADHTGGLAGVLEKNPNVTIYLPKAFADREKKKIMQKKNKIIEVENSKEICDYVYLIRLRGSLVIEQFLAVRTAKGIVLIAGCGHPGIVKIVKSAKELLKENILLVMGCFHLEWTFKGKIERIIDKFKKMNVRYVGPAHGTSDKARRLFRKHFGDNYIDVGAGKFINIAELE